MATVLYADESDGGRSRAFRRRMAAQHEQPDEERPPRRRPRQGSYQIHMQLQVPQATPITPAKPASQPRPPRTCPLWRRNCPHCNPQEHLLVCTLRAGEECPEGV